MARSKGYVKTFLTPKRTYGFLKDGATKKDVFFNIRELVPGQTNLLPLHYGDYVSFEIAIEPETGKTYAKDILVTETQQD